MRILVPDRKGRNFEECVRRLRGDGLLWRISYYDLILRRTRIDDHRLIYFRRHNNRDLKIYIFRWSDDADFILLARVTAAAAAGAITGRRRHVLCPGLDAEGQHQYENKKGWIFHAEIFFPDLTQVKPFVLPQA